MRPIILDGEEALVQKDEIFLHAKEKVDHLPFQWSTSEVQIEGYLSSDCTGVAVLLMSYRTNVRYPLESEEISPPYSRRNDVRGK